MSYSSPSFNDTQSFPFSSNTKKDLLSPDFLPGGGSIDLFPHVSSFVGFSSVSSQDRIGNPPPSAKNQNYIKVQDALNNFKSNKPNQATNPSKSLGFPHKVHYSQPTNKLDSSPSNQGFRSPSPKASSFTPRDTNSGRITQMEMPDPNRIRSSLTYTSLIGSPAGHSSINSARNQINYSRAEVSGHKQSPARESNRSLDHMRHNLSSVHKRENTLSHMQKTNNSDYRSPTSVLQHETETGVSIDKGHRTLGPETLKDKVLREILSPTTNASLKKSVGQDEGFNSTKKRMSEGDFISGVKGKLENATKCNKHNQPYLLFNTSTRQLTCVECVINTHRDAQGKPGLVSLKSANNLINDITRKLAQENDKKTKLFDQNIQICKKNISKVRHFYENLVSTVDKEFQELAEALEKRRNLVKATVSTIMEDTLRELAERTRDLEFLRRCLKESRDSYSHNQDFESKVEYFAVYNTLIDTIQQYNYQPSLLEVEDFAHVQFKGQSKLRDEIESIGKIFQKDQSIDSIERPKSQSKSFSSSKGFDMSASGKQNKSVERSETTIKIRERVERGNKTFRSTTGRDEINVSRYPATARAYTKELSDKTHNTSKNLSTREDNTSRDPKKQKATKSDSAKKILDNLISQRHLNRSGSGNKEDRHKRKKMLSLELSEDKGRKKRAHISAQNTFFKKAQASLEIQQQQQKKKSDGGLFEEIQLLECPTMTKLEDEVSISNTYREIESVLSSIRRKDILLSKGLEPNNSSTLFQDSNILVEKTKISDLCHMLPQGIKGYQLLYRYSQDGAGSDIFHEKCDNQGPCVLIAKVDGEYVFGYYTPIAFTSSDRYESCEDCFIFSLQNPLYQRSLKFPIKEHKKFFALFQSISSPCLGSTVPHKQDLFIQFDNLSESCSSIGYTYKLPSSIDGATVLAGRYTGWNFDEIEVYKLTF